MCFVQEIHKKIMSLNFNNCHARICQVDCQSSVGGSVVVQVNIICSVIHSFIYLSVSW